MVGCGDPTLEVTHLDSPPDNQLATKDEGVYRYMQLRTRSTTKIDQTLNNSQEEESNYDGRLAYVSSEMTSSSQSRGISVNLKWVVCFRGLSVRKI